MRIGRNRNRKRERERRASGKLGRNQGKGLCVVCIRNKRHYTRGRCFNQFRSHEFPAELFKTLKRATVRDTRYLSCIRIENIRMILLLLYVNYERNRFKVVSAITLLILIITYLVKLDFISSQINRLSKLSIHCPNIFVTFRNIFGILEISRKSCRTITICKKFPIHGRDLKKLEILETFDICGEKKILSSLIETSVVSDCARS